MRVNCCFFCLCFGWVVPSAAIENGGPGLPASDIAIRAVIANVSAFEQELRAFDVKVRSHYNFHEGEKSLPGEKQVLQSETHSRYIRQDGMYRVELTSSQTLGDGGQGSYRRTRAYDGNTSRALSGMVANVQKGYSSDEGCLFPHSIFLSVMGYSLPLAAYLSGDRSRSLFPGNGVEDDVSVRCDLLGEGSHDGFQCLVLRASESRSDPESPENSWVFHLATAHGFLPVKFEAFTHRWSKDVPLAVGTVDKLIKNSAGNWLPSKWTVNKFDKWKIEATGEQVPTWTVVCKATYGSFDPNFDTEYFSQLDIPNGAIVYQLDESGEITGSFTKQDPKSGKLPRTLAWSTMVLVFLLSVFLLASKAKRFPIVTRE